MRTIFNTSLPYTPGPVPERGDLVRYLVDELGRVSASINSIAHGNLAGQINPDGGFMVRLINKTGSASVKGEVVSNSASTANAVEKIVIDQPDPIGVFYESGVPDGGQAWVVVAGIAEVYFAGSTTLGHLACGFITGDTGYMAGQAKSEALPTSPFATDKHFYEIGHVLESRTGAGLARCMLHFN